MEQYKCLYKGNNSQTLSPRHNNINREIQEAFRNRQRKERFQGSRNISLSPPPLKPEVTVRICPNIEENESNTRNISSNPSPRKTEILVKICPEVKENEKVINKEGNVEIRIAKIVCNTTNPVKKAKQEAYLKRYLEWKEQKKLKQQQQQQENSNKKKPFISAICSSRQTKTTVNSIVPKGHHEGFKPPTGLKMPKVFELNSAFRKLLTFL